MLTWGVMSLPAYPLMVFLVSRVNKRDLEEEQRIREEKKKATQSPRVVGHQLWIVGMGSSCSPEIIFDTPGFDSQIIRNALNVQIKRFCGVIECAVTQFVRSVISPESITSSCPLSWRRTSRPDSSRFIAVPVMMTDPRLTETFFPNKSVLSLHFLITECPPSVKKKLVLTV